MAKYNPGIPQSPGVQRGAPGFPWLLIVFSGILFGFSLLIYGGLQGYNRVLDGQVADIDDQLQSLKGEVDTESQRHYLDFYSQIANVQKILNSHVQLSDFFSDLESRTNTRVKYNNIGVNASRNEITLDGVSESYERLAEQLESFRLMQGVTRVELKSSSVNTNGNRVDFSISVKVLPQAFQ